MAIRLDLNDLLAKSDRQRRTQQKENWIMLQNEQRREEGLFAILLLQSKCLGDSLPHLLTYKETRWGGGPSAYSFVLFFSPASFLFTICSTWIPKVWIINNFFVTTDKIADNLQYTSELNVITSSILTPTTTQTLLRKCCVVSFTLHEWMWVRVSDRAKNNSQTWINVHINNAMESKCH